VRWRREKKEEKNRKRSEREREREREREGKEEEKGGERRVVETITTRHMAKVKYAFYFNAHTFYKLR